MVANSHFVKQIGRDSNEA
jgi:D-glycero-alpha-D-manno-heptose-7-phosphate kinase